MGLSKLQRTILHEGRNRSPSVSTVDMSRVLARYLAWPSMGFHGDTRAKWAARRGELQHPQTPSKEDVGPHTGYPSCLYGTAHAAISRAVRRLEKRGLLVRDPKLGLVLTDAGLSVAKKIDAAKTFRQPTWVDYEAERLAEHERKAGRRLTVSEYERKVKDDLTAFEWKAKQRMTDAPWDRSEVEAAKVWIRVEHERKAGRRLTDAEHKMLMNIAAIEDMSLDWGIHRDSRDTPGARQPAP